MIQRCTLLYSTRQRREQTNMTVLCEINSYLDHIQYGYSPSILLFLPKHYFLVKFSSLISLFPEVYINPSLSEWWRASDSLRCTRYRLLALNHERSFHVTCTRHTTTQAQIYCSYMQLCTDSSSKESTGNKLTVIRVPFWLPDLTVSLARWQA